MRQINGMVVVITGASAGIGRALAVRLARGGAKLVLAARRTDRLDALNRELGGGHLCQRADVGVEADCAALIAAAQEKFGRIDTLVCNAGYGQLDHVDEMAAADWRRMFAVNVFGTVDCIRAALPLLAAQAPRDGWRGQVMIVSSCLARRSAPGTAAYSATKAAQLSIAEALRVEVKPRQIAVTSVHPVGTESEFVAVAETAGHRRMKKNAGAEPRQSAELVAEKMVRAIARPRPELWPYRPARWAFGLATLMPGVVDRMIERSPRMAAQQPKTEG